MSFEKKFDETCTCPNCGYFSFLVIESRPNRNGKRRRRSCSKCNHRETTYELNETTYKKLMKAEEHLSKIYKTLTTYHESDLEQQPTKTESIPCDSCELNVSGVCDLSLPEYNTEESSDCNYYKCHDNSQLASNR